MKWKISTLIAASVFSITSFAYGIFPGNFQSGFQLQGNCAVKYDNNAEFCTNFQKAVTTCSGTSLSMQAIYNMMISIYGGGPNRGEAGLALACFKTAKQRANGTVQGCIDQWNCYWNGGTDSVGNECSGTGASCTSCTGPYCP